MTKPSLKIFRADERVKPVGTQFEQFMAIALLLRDEDRLDDRGLAWRKAHEQSQMRWAAAS